jgi:hypothetical protein
MAQQHHHFRSGEDLKIWFDPQDWRNKRKLSERLVVIQI